MLITKLIKIVSFLNNRITFDIYTIVLRSHRSKNAVGYLKPLGQIFKMFHVRIKTKSSTTRMSDGVEIQMIETNIKVFIKLIIF